MTTILVVDDEQLNIELIKHYLIGTNAEIISANDGIQAWQFICKMPDNIDLILLDRNMPNMDGIEFMHKIKGEARAAHIPVIMQTAASEPEQISEGVSAGVYYYLIKPIEKHVLISLVDAALKDSREQKLLNDQLQQQKYLLNYMQRSELRFRTLQDAQTLAPILATFFPNPKKVLVGISELLINAVEHGNAGITYNEKTELIAKNIWRQEIDKRIDSTTNRHKRVRVSFERLDDRAILTIEDDGSGFDWQNYLRITPERASSNHGRGIAMSNMMSFDTLEYVGRGNKVICTVYLDDKIAKC